MRKGIYSFPYRPITTEGVIGLYPKDLNLVLYKGDESVRVKEGSYVTSTPTALGLLKISGVTCEGERLFTEHSFSKYFVVVGLIRKTSWIEQLKGWAGLHSRFAVFKDETKHYSFNTSKSILALTKDTLFEIEWRIPRYAKLHIVGSDDAIVIDRRTFYQYFKRA